MYISATISTNHGRNGGRYIIIITSPNQPWEGLGTRLDLGLEVQQSQLCLVYNYALTHTTLSSSAKKYPLLPLAGDWWLA